MDIPVIVNTSRAMPEASHKSFRDAARLTDLAILFKERRADFMNSKIDSL